MARIEVVFWQVDAGRMANETPALRLARLQAKILRGFTDAGPVDLRLFAVPEFYFFHANPSTDDLRWYSEAERDGVYQGVVALSQLRQNLLVVGGTICWAMAKQAKIHRKRRWHIHNEAPIAFGGAAVGLCGKRLYGGEFNSGDALRMYRSRKGHLDYTENYITDEDDEDGNPIVGRRQAPNIEAIAGHGSDRLRSGQVKSPGSKVARRTYENRILFRHRNSPKIYTLPGGRRLGVEICQEHNASIVRNAGQVDLHLIVSNTVGRQNNNNAVVEGGLMLHCDARGLWIGQRQGGAMVELDAWTDLGDGLYRQVVDADI